MNPPTVLAVAWFVMTTAAWALCWTPAVRRWLGRRRWPLLLAAGVALAARLVPAMLPLPADAMVRWDADSYRAVANAVAHHHDVYDLPGRYSYLPLQMYLLAAAGWLAAHTPLPFLFLVKLPAIAADAALALMVGRAARLVGRRDGAALAMVFALNPVSLLVTGYHGQFDALPISLSFGAWLVLAGSSRRWSTQCAALLLGLAIADKTWPALFAPLLLWRVRGTYRRAVFVTLAAVPPLACLALYEYLIPGGAAHAVRVVAGYQGYVGGWGISDLMLRAAPPGTREQVVSEASRVGLWLLIAALGVSYVVASRLRRDLDRMALILAATYAATAGWGVHWLSWIVPVAVVGARRWAAIYLVAAGAYVAAVYLGFGGVLWGFTWFTASVAPVRWVENAGLALWAGIALAVACTWLWVGVREGAAAVRRLFSGSRSAPRPAGAADALAARARP